MSGLVDYLTPGHQGIMASVRVHKLHLAEFDSRCSGAAKGLQPQGLGRKERFLRTLTSHTKQGLASGLPSHSGLKLRRALSKVSFIFLPLYSHSWLISTLSGAPNPIYMLMVPTSASQTQSPPPPQVAD